MKKNYLSKVKFVEHSCKETDNGLELILPIRVVSEANSSESFWEKHSRHKMQKNLIYYNLHVQKKNINLPCHVKLTRLSSRFLDDDNLVSSFKYVRDSIAACIVGDFRSGRADSSVLITWQYDQRKSPFHGAEIIISCAK